jgi:hypothetical protein
MESGCIGAVILVSKVNFQCRGLRTIEGEGQEIDQISESWSLEARLPAPLVSSVPKTSSCGNAKLAFRSTESSGFRFNNIHQKQVQIFKHQATRASMTTDDFRCDCLTRCSTTKGCKAVTIMDVPQGFSCYGLYYPGLPMPMKRRSESWVLP